MNEKVVRLLGSAVVVSFIMLGVSVTFTLWPDNNELPLTPPPPLEIIDYRIEPTEVVQGATATILGKVCNNTSQAFTYTFATSWVWVENKHIIDIIAIPDTTGILKLEPGCLEGSREVTIPIVLFPGVWAQDTIAYLPGYPPIGMSSGRFRVTEVK